MLVADGLLLILAELGAALWLGTPGAGFDIPVVLPVPPAATLQSSSPLVPLLALACLPVLLLPSPAPGAPGVLAPTSTVDGVAGFVAVVELFGEDIVLPLFLELVLQMTLPGSWVRIGSTPRSVTVSAAASVSLFLSFPAAASSVSALADSGCAAVPTTESVPSSAFRPACKADDDDGENVVEVVAVPATTSTMVVAAALFPLLVTPLLPLLPIPPLLLLLLPPPIVLLLLLLFLDVDDEVLAAPVSAAIPWEVDTIAVASSPSVDVDEDEDNEHDDEDDDEGCCCCCCSCDFNEVC